GAEWLSSDYVQVVTSAAPVDPPEPQPDPPSIPTGFSTVISSRILVAFGWLPSTVGDPLSIAGYRIWRDGATEGWPKTVEPPTFGDATVEAGNTYTYRVSSIDSSGRVS